MGQTNITIRIDEDLKKAFENLLENMGLNFTTAFNIFARQCIAEQEIPFKIKAVNIEEYFNIATINSINKSINEIEKGNGIVKTLKELENMVNE